ncbi:hypothetical protein EDD30_5958 [Couchioplanes caeruleus]|uniref:Uncharacterized protein n=2 Tax=Couchioplanes caeruleus TaxID=56438 RepID=A0A1K0FFT0_9ACTN|nr:hypothetical protein BG844_24825 [Couchioplanes caeruleus subsp. caeruleus]ROP32997.1 hypothetical protein EDD30_5958 [Couchioplanes caeruleus]
MPDHTVQVLEPELTEHDYLRQIELLARDVVHAAQEEGWQTYGPNPANATQMHRAVNELARALRHWHFDDDGCLDDDRPLLHLGGATVITPGSSPAQQESYRTGCARLGVDTRDEGWALWHTWDDKARAHTVVTTALDATHALLDNWSHGRDVHPLQPRRAQIAAVVQGWVGPITLSPSHATTIGLGGR